MAVLIVVSLAAYFKVNSILNWLAKPVGQFVFTSPGEAFFLQIKIVLGVGVIISFPFFIYQIWRFIEVALHLKEKSILRFVLPVSSLLFYLGMALALFGVAPLAVNFLLKFGSATLLPMISLDAYLSFLFWMMIGFGLFFQLPVVLVALSQAGVVNPDRLSLYRKHILVGILVLSAVLTPGPDVVSQLFLSIPAYFLFEISLIIARRFRRA